MSSVTPKTVSRLFPARGFGAVSDYSYQLSATLPDCFQLLSFMNYQPYLICWQS